MELRDQLLALGQEEGTTTAEKQPAEPDHPLFDYLKSMGTVDEMKRRAANQRDIAPIAAQTASAVDHWDDEAGDWEKEVKYRQDMLDSPAISGLPPEVLKSNLDYARRKHAEALAGAERAQALKNENLSDFGMAFMQSFPPSPAEFKALQQYAESAGLKRTARGAAGIAEFLSLEMAPPPGWKPLSWSDVHGFRDFGRFLSQESGSVAGMLAHFATIGAATGGAGVMADMVAMGHGQMRMALEEKGITDEATLAKGTYVYGTLIGGLQAVVPWATLRNLSPAATQAFVHSVAELAARTAEHSLTMGGAQVLAMSLASVAETYGVSDAEGKPVDWEAVAKQITDEAPKNFFSGMLFGVTGEAGKVVSGATKFGREPKPGEPPAPQGAPTPGGPAPETGQKTGQELGSEQPQPPEKAAKQARQELANELATLATERTPQAEARKTEIEQQLTAPAEEPAAAAAQTATAMGPAATAAPKANYIETLVSGEDRLPSSEDLRGQLQKLRDAEEEEWVSLGAPPGTAARVRQLNRIADTAGGERADRAIAELNALADKYADKAIAEPDRMDEDQLRQLVTEFDSLERKEGETPEDYADGMSRVLKRYLSNFMDGDPFARAVFRKAFEGAAESGISTQELGNLAIQRVVADLSASDRAFFGDMIREFTDRLQPAAPVSEAARAIPDLTKSETARGTVETPSDVAAPEIAKKSFDEMTDGELRLRQMEALSNLAENPTQAQQYFQAAWGDVAERFFQATEYDRGAGERQFTGEAKATFDSLMGSMNDVVQAIRHADKDAALAAMRAAKDRAGELLTKTGNATTAKLFTQWVDSAWKHHVEPLIKLQEAAAKPAVEISENQRGKFRDLLRGTAPRKQWAELMGADAATLGALIADAEKQGLLRVAPDGKIRRTAKARTGEAAPTEPAATQDIATRIRAIMAERQPGEQVPIADVYERLRAEGYDATLDEFKAELAREARAGRVELARHDIAVPTGQREHEGFWTYKTGAIPMVSDLPPGAFKGTQADFERLSPGMRQEILRTANKQAAERLAESRMTFGRDERHYVVGETPRSERVPTFEEMRGILPKDEGGDADMMALTGLMRDRFNKATWAELTPDEKRAAFAEFSPRYALRTLLPGRVSAEAIGELAARVDDMPPNERQAALDWLEQQHKDDIKAGEELSKRCSGVGGGFSISGK